MTTPTHPQQVAKSASAKNADERSDANDRHFADFNPDCGCIWLYRSELFTESNLLNITRQASINIVLAAGMTFIILTGGIDLSVGSILGTTAVAAMVVSLIPEFAMLSIPAALMLGMVLGLFNGALVAFAGLPPFIVTLGTYTALRGAACWRTARRSLTPTSTSSGSAITTSARSPAGCDRPGGDCGVLVYSASHNPRRSHLCGRRQYAGGALNGH